MKTIFRGLVALVSVSFIISCNDFKLGSDFLEKPISDELNIDTVFGQKKYAEQQLTQAYKSLPDHTPINGHLSWSIPECLTDIADCIKAGGTEYHKGAVTSNTPAAAFYCTDYGYANGNFSATRGIRQAYIYLENVDRVPDMTEAEKTQRKGEAKMIIAYHYVDMLRAYGGMPWIDHSFTPSDDMTMTRMSLEEAVQKISSLIDEAAAMLPWNVAASDDGRMTQASALALKSRMMTFVASPLFNNEKPFLEGEAATNHYVWWGNYDVNRWKLAQEAGLAFLRANMANSNFYKLVDNGDPRTSFTSGYFDRYNGESLITSHRFKIWNLNSYNISQIRFGVCSPVLNYADMFQMKDGSEFSWDNPEHRAHPFFDENFNEVRDPRLYETLIVTGDKFWGRFAEIYKGGREQPKAMGSGQNWRWGDLGHNGIAQRKYTQDHLNELQNKYYNCCLMRLPEIYLNIAEAMNEQGLAEQVGEFGRNAYDYVNLVRNRVDMPGISAATVAPGVALREYILDERAREFGYEDLRLYDINRWMHKDYLDVPLTYLKSYPVGSQISHPKKPAQKVYVNFTYEVVTGAVNQRVWVNNWSNKYYLCPISLTEINKKYGLIQNPGWE